MTKWGSYEECSVNLTSETQPLTCTVTTKKENHIIIYILCRSGQLDAKIYMEIQRIYNTYNNFR